MTKTVILDGEKIKIDYNNTFNTENNNSTNVVTIDCFKYYVNCLPNYRGWEYKGKTYPSEKQLVEGILKFM
jgi:hypothetical protein